MRWTPLLLLASACASTHAQPPPAPLSVSAEKAAGPADLPDAGVEDAGTPDAGSVDGGATRADLVSPITASGSETPAGLEWGEKGEEPAAKIFKNVKVLGELKGNRFMAGMQSMRANLGEKCPMCHLVKQKDFAADTKKEKRRAREMIRMNEEINRRTFGGEVKVTCWMCHRGEEEPTKRPWRRRCRTSSSRSSRRTI